MGGNRSRAVIFDLDGTLIDSAVSAAHVLNEMLRKRGLPATTKNQARHGVSLGAASLVTNALGAAAGDIDAAVVEFRAIYRAMQPDPAELFPHATDMLQALKNQNHPIGICTNKPEDLALHVIKGVGLAPYIKAIVGGRAGLASKPDPAPVFEVLKQLGATASDAVYVGDSEIDAEAAKAAGLPFIFVTFGYTIGKSEDVRADARIDDFRQLPELISKL